MPVWAWIPIGLVAGWVLVQVVWLALVGYVFVKELTRR